MNVYTLRFVKTHWTAGEGGHWCSAVLAVLCPLLAASAQYKALLSNHRLSSSTAAPFPVQHQTSTSLFCHKGGIMRDKYHQLIISYGYCLIHICRIKTCPGHDGVRIRVKNWAATRRNLARGISGSILCLMNYITLPNMLAKFNLILYRGAINQRVSRVSCFKTNIK